jgi:hypothetical protein
VVPAHGEIPSGRINNAVAFRDRAKAARFEQYV